MRIERVTDPQYLDVMTDWMYGWWGQKEHYTVEAVHESLLHSLNTDRLPQTFGLFDGDALLGMYQITNADLFVRPDLYPWLANVYLDPAYRGRGLGKLLLSSVPENAAKAGCGELYLFTERTGFYEALGWTFLGEVGTFLSPHIQRLYRMKIEGEK